ncbi:alpha/beta fold hydrolase [Roseibium sp.]|uniref:alpha/beta fold hydrolase n=1 Tax=Roseibium sp. TaxID=1936156 RepID=UPI003A96DBCA
MSTQEGPPQVGGANRDGRSTVLHWSADDGLRLSGRMWPAVSQGTRNGGFGQGRKQKDEAPTLLCLPGLSRNTRDFNDIASFVQARGTRVIALDYRGRGLSAWDDDWSHYSLEMESSDIEAGLRDLQVGRFAILGTSRGGLHAMAMAARFKPGRITGVILNDIGPNIEPASLSRIAQSIGKRMEFESASDLALRIAADLGDQFTSLSQAEWVKLAHQLGEAGGDGKFRLSYDPALAKTLTEWEDPGKAPPSPDLWPLFEALKPLPLLVVRGGNSDLLSDATCAEMKRRHENCDVLTIPDQGHAPLLWDSAAQETIQAFLSQLAETTETKDF